MSDSVLNRRAALGALALTAAAGAASAAPHATTGHAAAGHAPPAPVSPSRARAAASGSPAPAPVSLQPHAPAGHGPTLDPEAALTRLLEGNERFVSGRLDLDGEGPKRRGEVAASQSPYAVVLTCADSRLAPEFLFDEGIGDLFVVRVAGNVLSDTLLGSIEYGVIHLGASVVMVLGHERCGAVKATIDVMANGATPEDAATSIPSLVAAIQPAVEAAQSFGRRRDLLDAAIDANAAAQARAIVAKSPTLFERARAGKLMIVAARYDLDDGRVRMLSL